MSKRSLIFLKTAVWIGCLAPLGRLFYRGLTTGLGANPIEFVTLSTGTWALVFLLTTLAITPLRRLLRQNWLIKFRRPIGLFAFFYACLHFTTYVWLDQFFDLSEILKDIAKRPFITAGFLAFLLLVPLALTSSAGAIRRLGKRWQVIHSLIYVSSTAAVTHYWWKVKADVRQPAIYAAILAGLLLFRLIVRLARPRP